MATTFTPPPVSSYKGDAPGDTATFTPPSLSSYKGDAPEDKASNWLDSVERFGQGFYDKTLKGVVDLAGTAGHAIMHPLDTGAAIANSPIVQHPIDTVTKAATDAYKTHIQMLQQAKASLAKGDYGDAIQRGTNALMPVLGPAIQASVDKANAGDMAGGLGELAGMLASVAAAAPGATEAAAAKLGDLADAAGVSKIVPSAAKTLYGSALKPSVSNPGKAATAVETGLDAGIPVSEKGQKKLADLIGDLNQKTKSVIASNPSATVDPQAVASRLDQTSAKFASQALPQEDLGIIAKAKQDFLDANPNAIPASDAQAIKQGTYQQLKDKSFGELKSAQVESEKALARGIREELQTQFPELGPLNGKLSQFYGFQPYLEKAVGRIGNHNIISLGDMLAAGAGGMAGAMHGGTVEGAVGMAGAALMRHVLDDPGVKSRLAIFLNGAARNAGKLETPAATTARIGAYVQNLDTALGRSSSLPMAAQDQQTQLAQR